MGDPIIIKSDFAILDVKKGRKALFRRLNYTPNGPRANEDRRVSVVIVGYIVGAHGGDDGVSREFEVEVTEVRHG
ncbi:MAG: hypothetical protein F8N15_01405 [Methanobacterium sp.]|nr:hypothetical protein [Methanobacterium sp.]